MRREPLGGEENVSVADMEKISGYRDAVEILRSPEFYSPLHHRFSREVVGGSILSLYGDEHKERRRVVLAALGAGSLVRYEFDIAEPALRRQLSSENLEPGTKIDVIAVLTPIVIRVAAAVIGIDGMQDAHKVRDLTEIGRLVADGVQAEWSNSDVGKSISKALSAKARFIDNHFRASFSRRVKLMSEGVGSGPADELAVQRSDDIILSYLRRHELVDAAVEEELIRECLLWLTAATDTTIHSSAHAFNEICSWLERHPEQRRRFDEVAFLQRSVSEGIRLHAPLPSALRRALAPGELSSGRSIGVGQYLDVDLNAADRDPEEFGSDAEAFNPDRSSASSSRAFGVAFGHGVHSCPGRRLAVGAGNGKIEAGNAPVGLAVRFVQLLLASGAELDPLDPPRLRAGVSNDRWDRFPVIITNPLSPDAS
jgi:cytochrome P450